MKKETKGVMMPDKNVATENLLPCPFCAAAPRVERVDFDDGPPSWGIACGECLAITLASPSLEEAKRWWNQRSWPG